VFLSPLIEIPQLRRRLRSELNLPGTTAGACSDSDTRRSRHRQRRSDRPVADVLTH
jgi:hypothetical protein